MNRFKKTILILISLFLLLSMLSSCSAASKYRKNWIIGRHYEEVIERYGKFDLIRDTAKINEEGDYSNTACGYFLKEEVSGDIFYLIYFNSEGIAYEVNKNYRRGGG